MSFICRRWHLGLAGRSTRHCWGQIWVMVRPAPDRLLEDILLSGSADAGCPQAGVATIDPVSGCLLTMSAPTSTLVMSRFLSHVGVDAAT